MGHPSRDVLRFSDFELDLDSGELRKAGTTIKLRPQAFKNHLLAGGGLRVTPPLVRATNDSRGCVSRLVLFAEYVNTVRYYAILSLLVRTWGYCFGKRRTVETRTRTLIDVSARR